MKDMKPAPMPTSGHKAPAAKGGKGPGAERSANMAGAARGQPTDGLAGAIAELRSQHPIKEDKGAPKPSSLGISTAHIRHEPVSRSPYGKR